MTKTELLKQLKLEITMEEYRVLQSSSVPWMSEHNRKTMLEIDHTFLHLSLLYLQKTAAWTGKCEVYCAGKGRSHRILLSHESQRSRYSLFFLCMSGSFSIK